MIEADLRAQRNPTRRRLLTRLGQRLAHRLAIPCPACRCPGFGRTDTEPGLSCAACGLRRHDPRRHRRPLPLRPVPPPAPRLPPVPHCRPAMVRPMQPLTWSGVLALRGGAHSLSPSARIEVIGGDVTASALQRAGTAAGFDVVVLPPPHRGEPPAASGRYLDRAGWPSRSSPPTATS